MAQAGGKKKLALIGLAGVLLVAMIVGVAVGVTKAKGSSKSGGGSGSSGSVSTSTKAVEALCAPTDFKDTCKASVSRANSTDPKELVKVAFQYTMDNIGEVIKNSTLFQEAAKDPQVQGALEICKETLHDAIDDFKRSFEHVDKFDINKLNEYTADLLTWLSATSTYQETCLDAFENTTGETGEKMKALLRTAGELSDNALAMVNDLSQIFSQMQIGGFSRRLMSSDDLDSDGFPSFVDGHKRKLLAVDLKSVKPNVVVAQDGSGKFKTIQEAINTVPKNNAQPFVILVKAGTYREYANVPKHINNVVLIGEGPTKTRITGNKSYAKGVKTYHSATFAVNADGFVAKDIGFENTAGPTGHQAVALRVSGDAAIFYNCNFDGYQDTLYTHTYRQFYRDCTVSGTIDFIFGDAMALFQNCTMVVRKPGLNQACMVTAQGRQVKHEVSGYVLQNCKITAEPDFLAATPPVKAYLGRPWKNFSRTIIMQSDIDGFIDPTGWAPWAGTVNLDTCYYGEYQNRGPGAAMDKRVKWKGIQKITPDIAASFTGERVFKGGAAFIEGYGVPYEKGMMKV